MPKQNEGPRLAANEFGIYEVRWSEAGRSKRVSTRTTNMAEAQRFLAGWILERDRAQADTIPVADILDHYRREHIDAGGVADPDSERFRLIPLRAFFGDMMPRDIDAQAVNEYGRRRRSGRLGRAVKPATVRRELTALIAAINLAARDRRIPRDDVPHIPLPAQSEPRDYWLRPDELDRLMDAAAEGRCGGERLPRPYRFAAIARYTAARKRAIETLTWAQVDMERRLIDFREPGKRASKKRRVAVPIADALMPILETAKREAVSEYVLDHPGSIRKAFEKAAERAGLPDATPHVLRHTWATLAAQQGVSLWQIAGVLGDTMATVERNYLKHCPDHLRGAVNAGQNPGTTPDPGVSGDQQWPTKTVSVAGKR